MKVNNYLLPSLIVAAGLAIAGWTLGNGIVSFKQMDRRVTVKGLAEREVMANKVTWSLTYKEIGNDPAEMYELLERKNAKVVAFLKSAGIQEADIRINPPVIADREADNYGNEIMNFRYKAKCVITVTSAEVDKVGQLMRRQAELMKEGVALVSEEYANGNVTYEFTGLNDIKPEMVEEATNNARMTAAKFAADSNCELGDIFSAKQGQFSIEDRDSNTPQIKRVRVVNTIEYLLK